MTALTSEVLVALRAPYSRKGISSARSSAPGRGMTHAPSSSASSYSSRGVSEAHLSSAARRSASFDVPFTAPIIGSSSSSSSARPSRDRPDNSASDYPHPVAAAAAAQSINPHPAGAAAPSIPLLLLESAPTKKSSAAALKRDAEQMLRRVEVLTTHLYPAGPQRVAVVKSSTYVPGMIIGMRRTYYAVGLSSSVVALTSSHHYSLGSDVMILTHTAVDLPFAAVRNMCTFLMTKLSSPSNSSTRQEFDALVAASDRRATKLLLTQLIAYAHSMNSSSSSSKPQMPTGKNAPIEAACILVLFIYSIPGDQVDLLRVDAKAVCDRLELLKGCLSPSPSH